MSSTAPPNHDSFVTAQQLCVGLFVMLDLPWFKHNFTLNNFKIRNDEQLRELRELKLPRYRYDPQRCDAQALATLHDVPAVGEVTPAAAAEPLRASALEAEPPSRRLAQAKRQEMIANVERAFGKAASTMKNLNRNLLARPKETLEDMGGLVDQMVEAFLQSPETTLQVMGDKLGGEDVYFHSMNVTILAMMLAKEMGLDADAARDLGIGAMLHDIGLMEIPDRVLLTDPDDYNTAERNLRMMHVAYGGKIAAKLGLSPGATAVIAQHHEWVDGSGYPQGLRGEQMTDAAKLVSLVNYYDNLCNPVNIKKAMTPHKALSYMFAQCRAKFDAKALQLMIRSLGVYPPGSIVQLSNDALAMVTSVNPKKPLRPWVLVYDESVPKEEAPMLDLEQEPQLTISKSIAPGLLAPKALAYLNPRKRVTYFFDATDSESRKSV